MADIDTNMDENLVNDRGGFWNLLRRESQLWWGTRRWIANLAASVIGLNGLLAYVLFVLPAMIEASGESLDAGQAGVQLFFGLGFMAAAIVVVIMLQESIMTEKQTGTMEWVLSKPVSRSSYLLAKMLAHAIPMSLLYIFIPTSIGYLLFQLSGQAVDATFWLAVGLFLLHMVFYLILTSFMAVHFENRMLVLVVGIGSILGGSLAVNLLGPATLWTPWPLAGLAIGLAGGSELPFVLSLSILFTLLWCVVGVWITMRRFDRMDL
jgi:ABC-2 type transport system permease protein